VSELENIEGIGKKTAALLLKNFKSVKAVKEATDDELGAVVGKDKTQKVRLYFEQIVVNA
jgi:excinuclease ABC subunit C